MEIWERTVLLTAASGRLNNVVLSCSAAIYLHTDIYQSQHYCSLEEGL